MVVHQLTKASGAQKLGSSLVIRGINIRPRYREEPMNLTLLTASGRRDHIQIAPLECDCQINGTHLGKMAPHWLGPYCKAKQICCSSLMFVEESSFLCTLISKSKGLWPDHWIMASERCPSMPGNLAADLMASNLDLLLLVAGSLPLSSAIVRASPHQSSRFSYRLLTVFRGDLQSRTLFKVQLHLLSRGGYKATNALKVPAFQRWKFNWNAVLPLAHLCPRRGHTSRHLPS